MSSLRNPTAAIVQYSPVYLNLEASLAKGLDGIRRAAADGADIVVFPEVWLPGYPLWVDYSAHAARWDHGPAKALYRIYWENSVSDGGEHLAQVEALAGELGVYVVIGACERRGQTLYNSLFYFDPVAGRRYVHRKLVPTYGERLVWGVGDGSTLAAFDTPFGTVGGLICWEHWMPLVRAAMHAKGEHIHVGAWSSGSEMHLVASRHYAFEGRTFFLAAGNLLSHNDLLAGIDSLGLTDDRPRRLLESLEPPAPDGAHLLAGGSAIIDPMGRYLVDPVEGREDILLAELDMALVREGHLTLDTAGHYSRPDLFELQVNVAPQPGVRFESPADEGGEVAL